MYKHVNIRCSHRSKTHTHMHACIFPTYAPNKGSFLPSPPSPQTQGHTHTLTHTSISQTASGTAPYTHSIPLYIALLSFVPSLLPSVSQEI